MRKLPVVLLILMLLFASTGLCAFRPAAVGDLFHKGPSGYDVRSYGATGDGSTDDASSITTAAAAAAGGRLIFPKGTYRISSNLTLDEDIQIHKGAQISIDVAQTLTLTGALFAGKYQIFSGAGSVSLSTPVNEISPEWFGGSAVSTFTDADATPSVAQGRVFKTANTGGTTIPNFTDGIAGQVIRVLVNDANTTFDFTASNLLGNGGSDWTAGIGDSLIAVYDGTNWYCNAVLEPGTIEVSKDLVVSGTGMSGGENDVFPGADADVNVTLTVAKDIVAGGGLTGGEDNVLPGADADTTLAVGAGDGVIVNADEIEVYGLVASDGSPTTAVEADAEGDLSFGQAAASMETTSQYEYLMDAVKNILIDGSTNQRNMTLGLVRILHTPSIADTSALNFIVDANSQGDTHAIRIALSATDIVAGEELQGIGVSLDSADSTGGVMDAFRVSNGGPGIAKAHALHTDPGVIPIHQETGTFGAVEQAWYENGGFSDVTIAFNSTGTDVELFSTNGVKIYIGDASDFNSLRVNLATVASGAGIKPTFEYSIAGPAWTAFVPNDATDGFRVSAQITWDETTFSSWVAVTVNAVSKKYIRITRTQVGLSTPPIEDTIQVLKSVEFHWDENGNLLINDLDIAGDLALAADSYIANELKYITFTLAFPEALQTEDNEWPLIPVTPRALTIVSVIVTLDAVTNDVTSDLMYADAFIGQANSVVVNDLDTTSGVRTDTSISSGSVAAGKAIYFSFDGAPHADVKSINVMVGYYYD